MQNTDYKVKFKAWAPSAGEVQAALDALVNLYAPNITTSPVLKSAQGGYHAFATVFKGGGRR